MSFLSLQKIEFMFFELSVAWKKLQSNKDPHHYFLIEAAFVDHEGKELCNTSADATIDNFIENKFTKQNGFLEKVKKRRNYPIIETVWEELTKKLEGEVLFISFGGKIGADLPIDYQVLQNALDVKDYRFRDAYTIIPNEYCMFWRNGRRYRKRLGQIYRELFSKEMERSHQAIGDALALQKILEKLGLIQQFLKILS